MGWRDVVIVPGRTYSSVRLWIIPQAVGMDMDMDVLRRLGVRVDLRLRVKFNISYTL